MKILLAFLVFVCSNGLAKVSANVNPSLPTYEILDRLEAFGCARPTFRAIRPQGYYYLRESIAGREDRECPAPEWLLKEREILLSPFFPNDASLGAFLFHNDTVPLTGIEAMVTPAYPLRQGRDTLNGPNVYGEFSASAELGRDWGLALAATPGLLFALDDFKHIHGRFYLHEAYVKAGYKQLEITYGKTALQFGEAKHGTLILSQAARPIDLLKIGFSPYVIGEPLKFLGPFSFETWFAGQGETLFVKETRLWGIELGFRPTRWLELAFLEIYQYGGLGVPDLSTSDYLKMLFYSGASDLTAKRNRSFAHHFNLWLGRHYAKVYGQFLFESLTKLSSLFSDDISVLLGVWFPKMTWGELRVEFVHTVPTAYQHAFWKQGFSYKGSPLGHPVGPDGQAVYIDLGFPPVDDWRPTLNLAYEGRAVSMDSSETRYVLGLEAITRLIKSEISISAKYVRAQNHRYVVGKSSNLFEIFGWLRYSFF